MTVLKSKKLAALVACVVLGIVDHFAGTDLLPALLAQVGPMLVGGL